MYVYVLGPAQESLLGSSLLRFVYTLTPLRTLLLLAAVPFWLMISKTLRCSMLIRSSPSLDLLPFDSFYQHEVVENPFLRQRWFVHGQTCATRITGPGAALVSFTDRLDG